MQVVQVVNVEYGAMVPAIVLSMLLTGCLVQWYQLSG